MLFPEAVAHLTETGRERLVDLSDRDFLAGATDPVGDRLDNVLVHVDPERGVEVVYRQRMPALWFMWWGGRGSSAPIFGVRLSFGRMV